MHSTQFLSSSKNLDFIHSTQFLSTSKNLDFMHSTQFLSSSKNLDFMHSTQYLSTSKNLDFVHKFKFYNAQVPYFIWNLDYFGVKQTRTFKFHVEHSVHNSLSIFFVPSSCQGLIQRNGVQINSIVYSSSVHLHLHRKRTQLADKP